ncbi:MAG: hypothetical protein DME49_02175 [Verrucomicrobia bacterium]|nr:MAG: hypothetical protein DME49_02175 [Verrucomicrobiota bacterium]PYK94674.1 MAG: hypothetical protein DME36_04850 [Verrucomicrobiota bacterium]
MEVDDIFGYDELVAETPASPHIQHCAAEPAGGQIVDLIRSSRGDLASKMEWPVNSGSIN